jgi:hypothetical protein
MFLTIILFLIERASKLDDLGNQSVLSLMSLLILNDSFLEIMVDFGFTGSNKKQRFLHLLRLLSMPL